MEELVNILLKDSGQICRGGALMGKKPSFSLLLQAMINWVVLVLTSARIRS
jgi:hypothetical protein